MTGRSSRSRNTSSSATTRPAFPASPPSNPPTTKWQCGAPAAASRRDRGMANSSPEIPLQPSACVPYAGRLLQPSDDVKGAAPVAVLSFQAWEQKLGRDPSAIGSSFTINGQPVTIVGIAPPGFFSERLSPTPPALWLPIHLLPVIRPIDADLLERGGQQWLNLIGRIAPGANHGGHPGADAGGTAAIPGKPGGRNSSAPSAPSFRSNTSA